MSATRAAKSWSGVQCRYDLIVKKAVGRDRTALRQGVSAPPSGDPTSGFGNDGDEGGHVVGLQLWFDGDVDGAFGNEKV